MTTISSHALRSDSPQAVSTSRSWSLRSLVDADRALKDAGGSTHDDPAIVVCGRAKSMGSYNLGMLAEVSPFLSAIRAISSGGIPRSTRISQKQACTSSRVWTVPGMSVSSRVRGRRRTHSDGYEAWILREMPDAVSGLIQEHKAGRRGEMRSFSVIHARFAQPQVSPLLHGLILKVNVSRLTTCHNNVHDN